MIEGIAQLSMDLQADELYTAYAVALSKKAMEVQAASAENLLAEMLPVMNAPQNIIPPSAPPAPAVTEAHYIDTYA